MRAKVELFLLVCLVVAGISVILTAGPSLTETQKLKAENFKLKSQLSQCLLNVEQRSLIEDFALTLKPSPNSQFDWLTLSFKTSQLKAEETLK